MIKLFDNPGIHAFDFKVFQSTLEAQNITIQGEIALITVSGGSIRYRFDGGDPNPTEGHIASSGDSIMLIHPSHLSNFKFIQGSTIPSTLSVTYGRHNG
jgi:hypothetical protein